MSNVRQYVGARYVFKIYENSVDQNSAEWEANTTYEPLTIVTYNNSSYASKKDVPATVGDPANNPQYWVITGAYNGQIASLQNQIDVINNTSIPALQSQIDVLSVPVDRTIVISDSYGMNVAGNFIDKLRTYDPTIIASAVGGSSFVQSLDFPEVKNFYRQLTETIIPFIEANNIEKRSIKNVLIAGGYNDGHYTNTSAGIAAVRDQMAIFVAKVKEEFPNARPLLAFLGWQLHSENATYSLNDQIEGYNLYKVYGATEGFAFIENTETIMFQRGMIDPADPFHPTAAAGSQIAAHLFNALNFGADSVYSRYNNFSSNILTAETGISIIPGQGRLTCQQCNRSIRIHGIDYNNIMAFEFTDTFNMTNGGAYDLAEFEETYGCFNMIYKMVPASVYIIYEGNTQTKSCLMNMGIRDRKLFIQNPYLGAFNNVSKIIVQNFDIEFDPYYDSVSW